MGVGDSGVGRDVYILRPKLWTCLILFFDNIVSSDSKLSESSPTGSIHGEHAHVLVESTALHYWGSEGTGVERPRFG